MGVAVVVMVVGFDGCRSTSQWCGLAVVGRRDLMVVEVSGD